MAKLAHLQGDVVLLVLIDKDGNVDSIHALSGHPILINPAMKAVQQWIYKPVLLNGEPVSVETTVTVSFQLVI
jgi:TonB family protein